MCPLGLTCYRVVLLSSSCCWSAFLCYLLSKVVYHSPQFYIYLKSLILIYMFWYFAIVCIYKVYKCYTFIILKCPLSMQYQLCPKVSSNYCYYRFFCFFFFSIAICILKEIKPEYSLEGLILKLKLQYFGHLIWRINSLAKILLLGKIEGRKRWDWQRMRWLDAPSLTHCTWVWANSGR